MKKIIALVSVLLLFMTTPVFSATNAVTSTKATTTLSKPNVTLGDFDDSVILVWPNSENVKFYKVLRGTSENDLKLITTTDSSPYNDKNLAEDQTYYYEIIACNDKEESNPSNILIKPGVPEEVASQVKNGYKSLTSNNGDFYFKASINGSTLSVSGKNTLKNADWIMVSVNDDSDCEQISKAIRKKDSKGEFSLSLGLPLNDGNYYLNISTSKSRHDTYEDSFSFVPLKCKNKNLYFMSSPFFINNYKVINLINKDDITEATSKFANDNIRKKTAQIIKGIKDPRSRVKVIHDWIVDNIYFDCDQVKMEDNNKLTGLERQDAATVFKNKRGVCRGFADLFMAMVREADIPCLKVHGYGIDLDSCDALGKINKNTDGHAWNVVYLDGKWINVDTTWDCSNTYENKKYISVNKRYVYFDSTLEFFSLDHEIESIKSQHN